ncbi:ADP-ribose pyrophosphatase NudF [Methyloglobulus morosus KoM1]|uniref:ADP-ribose pyrophosphatase n=1 Tax=Methyloglobulus morosus KoM1 TaxID=1116472 RepID=V5C7D6_9GAMM|nr:NUDIX domain-containing protein [Methyloglobulus morosus]ESS72638.1 ADP-ribose pyrophosphatase NudF [Methyloglobulus morosus KoM1]
MKKEFEIIKRDVMYDGFYQMEKYYIKHTLFGGGWSGEFTRELFRRTNCVAVLLYDPVADKVVLIEQFRIGAAITVNTERAWLVEIVGGAIDEGETAEEVARRESQEEAGCDILELTLINRFYTTPGGSSELISLFYGRVDSTQVGGIHGLDHEDEDILVYAVPFDEVYRMLEVGEIESGIAIVAIQWLALHRESLREGQS